MKISPTTVSLTADVARLVVEEADTVLPCIVTSVTYCKIVKVKDIWFTRATGMVTVSGECVHGDELLASKHGSMETMIERVMQISIGEGLAI